MPVLRLAAAVTACCGPIGLAVLVGRVRQRDRQTERSDAGDSVPRPIARL